MGVGGEACDPRVDAAPGRRAPCRTGLSRGLVRVAFVLFGLFGVGELVYIVLWVLIPKAR